MKEINLGIIGLGHRGKGNTDTILNVNNKNVHIKAVCDLYQDRVEDVQNDIIKKGFDKPFGYTDYKELLDRKDINTIVVFTSWESHIKIAIDAMKKGFAVGVEVGGAYTVDECYELVETWEEKKVPFMMFENCCFGEKELTVQNMVREGLFGDVKYLRGAYAHDLRNEILTGKEKRHYRLRNYIGRNCENYPTHELGPIAKIIDINRGNRMTKLLSVASGSYGLKYYVDNHKDTIENKELIGQDFKQADVVETNIMCENGEMISIKLDTTLPRYYSREFEVRGTKGMYNENTHCVFLDGDEEIWDIDEFFKKQANNFNKYKEKYAPEEWKNITKEEIDQGHGGMDVLCFRDFFDCLLNDKPMHIDVYDAASWMAITALSQKSLESGNKWVEIPDFTKGKYKERKRYDVE